MSIYRFANSDMFYWLLVVVTIVIVNLFLKKQFIKKLAKQMGEKVYPVLIASLSVRKRQWKFFLEMFVIVLMVFSIARLQSGKARQKVKSEGIELLLMVDVSNSMLAEDVKPSRLEHAKKAINTLLDLAWGDRIGLIAFAGSSAILSPLTQDKSALKMYVESLNNTVVSSQGTVFKDSLKISMDAFQRGGIEADEKSKVTRAILIISDGEDNEPGALKVAKEVAEKGVRIFTLAVGTEKGAPIPIRDRNGNLKGYRKDKSRQVIMTKTQGTILKSLSQEGKGSFYHSTIGGQAVKKIYKDIQKLEKSTFESDEVAKYDEKFQTFLFFAILFALIELFLGDRKKMGRIWRGRFEVSKD